MQDISYLYFNDGFEIKSFECQPEKLVVISLKSNNNTKIDINLEEELDLNTSTGLFSYKCSKSISEYDINRETSIFNLIESGCIPTDHKIFKQLSIARTVFQN